MMHTYQLQSNKEQGFGFSDLTLIPLDKKNSLGLIFEFKHVKHITKKNFKDFLLYELLTILHSTFNFLVLS